MKKFINNIVLKRLLSFRVLKHLILNVAYVFLFIRYIPIYFKGGAVCLFYKLKNRLRATFSLCLYFYSFLTSFILFFLKSYRFKQLNQRADYFIARFYRFLIGRRLSRMKRYVITNERILSIYHRMYNSGYVYESVVFFYDRVRGKLGFIVDVKALVTLVHKYIVNISKHAYLYSPSKVISKTKVIDWHLNPSIGLKFSKAYLYLDTVTFKKQRHDLLRRYPLDPYYAAKFVPIAPMVEAFYARDQYLVRFPDIEEDYLMSEDPESFTECFDLFEWGYFVEEDIMYEVQWQFRPNFYEWLEWHGYPVARRDWLEDIDRLSLDTVRRQATIQGVDGRYLRQRVIWIYESILEEGYEDSCIDELFFTGKKFFEECIDKNDRLSFTPWEQFREKLRLRTFVSNWVSAYIYVGFNAFERVHDHAISLSRLQRNRFLYNVEKREDFFSIRALPSTGWVELVCLIMVGMAFWLIALQWGLVDVFHNRQNGFVYADYGHTIMNVPRKLDLLYHSVQISSFNEYPGVWHYLHDRGLTHHRPRLISNFSLREAYSTLAKRYLSQADTLQHPLLNHSYNLVSDKARNWTAWKAPSPIYLSLWEQQEYWRGYKPTWYDRFMEWRWFQGFPFAFTFLFNPAWLDWQRNSRTQLNWNPPPKLVYHVDIPAPWDNVPYLKKYGIIPSWLKLPEPRVWLNPRVKTRYLNENVLWRDHFYIIHKLHDANFIQARLPSMSVWEEQLLTVVKLLEIIPLKLFKFLTVSLPYYLAIPVIGVPFSFIVILTLFYLLRGKWFGWTRKLDVGDPNTYFGLLNFPFLEAVRFIYYQSNFETSNPIFRFLYTIELLKNPKFSRFMLYRHLLYRESPPIAAYFSNFVYPFADDFMSFKFQFSSFNDESYVNAFDDDHRVRFWRLWYVSTIQDEFMIDPHQTYFYEQFSEYDVEQDEPDEDGGDFARHLPNYYLRDLEYDVKPFWYTRYTQTYRSRRLLNLCAKHRYFKYLRGIILDDIASSRVKPFFLDIENYIHGKDLNELPLHIVPHVQFLLVEATSRYSGMIFKGWSQEEKWMSIKRFRRNRKIYRPFYRYMLRGYKQSNYLFTYQSVNRFLFDFSNVLLPHMYLGEGGEDIGIYYFNSDYYSRSIARVDSIAAHSLTPWYGVNCAFSFYKLERPSRAAKLTTDIREYEMWDFYLSHHEYDHDYLLQPIALDGYKWLNENEALNMAAFDENFKLSIREVTAHAEEFDLDLEFDRPLPDDEETEHTMFFYNPLGLKLGAVSYFPADYSLEQMKERGFVLSIEECYWAYNRRKTWIDIIECDDDIAPIVAFSNVDFGVYLVNGFFSSRYFNYDMYSEEDGPVYPRVGTVEFALSERGGFPHPHYHFPYKSSANLVGSWPQSLGRGTYDGMARFVLGDLRIEEDKFDKEEILSLRLPPWQAEYLASDPDMRFVFRTWEQNYAVYDNADDFERYHWLMDTHLWITYPLGYAWDSPL